MSNQPKILGLGEPSKSTDYRLVQSSYPLPTTRKGIISAVESILDMGGVQKLTVQVGQPIKFDRLVTEFEDGPPQEFQDDDILAAVRNAEMDELDVPDSMGAFESLFRAFHLVSGRRFDPYLLIVKDFTTLRQWLNVDQLFDVTEVFGVRTVSSKQVPEGSMLLVSVRPESDNQISYTVRIPVSLSAPKRKKK